MSPTTQKSTMTKMMKRAQRHFVVLFFAAGVFVLFVVEAALPLELALLGFGVVFISSFVYLEQPLPMSTARRKRSGRGRAMRRDAADLLPHATMLLDTNGTIRLANLAALDLFRTTTDNDNLQEDDLRGEPLSAILREPNVLNAFDRCVKNNEVCQVKWEVAGGVPRFFAATVAPALAPRHDAPPFVLLTLEDQTDMRFAEKMRSDFIANASHELKTPLSVFIGYLEALRGVAADDVAQRNKFLDVMERQSARMVQLVEDLLSLSRIEQKEHIPPQEEVQLGNVIQEAIALNESVAEKLAMKVKWTKPTEPCLVLGSHSELTQAFNNLVHNALTHGVGDDGGAGSGGGGDGGARKEIEITLTPLEAAWHISIRDFGAGIAPHHIPRLTERFYRINPEESRKLGGTGLGLAIVKHILTRHRGELEIESQVGVGSVFSAVLPAA